MTKITAAEDTIAEVNAAWKAEALAFLDVPIRPHGACPISDVHGGADSVQLRERPDLENDFIALREMSQLRQQLNVARSGLEPERGAPRFPNPTMVAAIERADSPDDWGYDWLLLTTDTTAASLINGSTFKPGSATGWLMVWGYDEGRFVCAGAFDAENSDRVGVAPVGETGSLRWDLAAQAFEMGQAGLLALPE